MPAGCPAIRGGGPCLPPWRRPATRWATCTSRVGIADVDLAIDSTGRPGVRESAVGALGKRGVLVCVGHGDLLTFDVSRDLIAPERAVLGSEYFPYADLERNLGLLREHRRELGQMITHRFPVSRLDDAFETFCGRWHRTIGRSMRRWRPRMGRASRPHWMPQGRHPLDSSLSRPSGTGAAAPSWAKEGRSTSRSPRSSSTSSSRCTAHGSRRSVTWRS